MTRLNYNHLLYFRAVAEAGSFSAASRQLKLSQPTVSEQIHIFERAIGRKLFVRAGNRLELTPSGKLILRYAKKIFRIGDELSRAITDGKLGGAPERRHRNRKKGRIPRNPR